MIEGVVGGGRGCLEVVEGGWRWSEVVEGGWRWLKVVEGGRRWLEVVEGGRSWLEVDGGGWRWLKVVGCGRRRLNSDRKGVVSIKNVVSLQQLLNFPYSNASAQDQPGCIHRQYRFFSLLWIETIFGAWVSFDCRLIDVGGRKRRQLRVLTSGNLCDLTCSLAFHFHN